MESANALRIMTFLHSLFAKCFSKNAQLIDKLQLTHDTFCLTFRTRNMDHTSHIRVKYEDIYRKYSPILSSPNRFCIVVKKYQTNGVSQYLCDKQIGDWIEIDFYENLRLRNVLASNLVVFIAGTGITPIVPLLNETNPPSNISILYSNKTRDDLLFADLLSKFNTKLFFTREPEKTRITEEVIANEIKNHISQVFFVCGPHSFTRFVISTLEKYGIDGEQIIT